MTIVYYDCCFRCSLFPNYYYSLGNLENVVYISINVASCMFVGELFCFNCSVYFRRICHASLFLISSVPVLHFCGSQRLGHIAIAMSSMLTCVRLFSY
jgi:hypothetical protein